MALMKRIVRDQLGRVIKHGDLCVWTNKKQGYGLEVVRVKSFSKQCIIVVFPGTDKWTRIMKSSNLIVITQQVADNFRTNVGANIDLENYREGDKNGSTSSSSN